ncbi:hypothetical protein L3X39_02085 [Sabulilitoribacter multivorans]|uniref:RES domain-containing protein n=1 Tax=Flaviramulus multivorans TaxID=1304750 RepID=A0ABS9IFN3_9FLAO|nr:hypothetical protein [Flaviramulus multivorans]MCF7559410.1 hypothetical protein [Flaviramulus multivorans]
MVTKNDIIKIKILDIANEVNFAFITSYKKSNKENTANTWQPKRSPFKKFTDLFPGDLAKNIVRFLLEQKNLIIQDYDKIRTDNFRFNDKFDLKFNNKEIEVKSSIEKYSNDIQNLIVNRRYIVYPNRNISDLIFQVFYIFENQNGKEFFNDMEQLDEKSFISKYSLSSKKVFVQKFVEFSPCAYVMGFITKSMALQKKNDVFVYSNDSIKEDNNRSYIDFFINEGLSFSVIKEYL